MVESKPSPQPPSTVQALLAESLLHEKSASTFAVYDIPVAGFEDYLLRIRKKNVAGVREQLLNSTSLTSPQQSLTVPDFFFVGPKVSQSLLHWGDNKQDIPRIEIVRKHPGITLAHFIDCGFENHSNGKREENRTQLVKALLTNPEALRSAFEQAAFVGYQKIVPIGADLHNENIMVAPDLTLSLIDRVGQSDLVRSDNYPNINPVTVAESHIGWLYQTLKRELRCRSGNEVSRAAYKEPHIKSC